VPVFLRYACGGVDNLPDAQSAMDEVAKGDNPRVFAVYQRGTSTDIDAPSAGAYAILFTTSSGPAIQSAPWSLSLFVTPDGHVTSLAVSCGPGSLTGTHRNDFLVAPLVSPGLR
jgi:hypothetical protein